MKRVMVIGSCGAGKTQFSKKLSLITGLELVHLDQHYWKENWQETDSGEWKKRVHELAQRPSWIIDGNYGGTIDIRLNRADTIFFLDYPTWKCLWRIITRTLKNWGKARPEMPAGCKERFDLEFLHYVATFNLIRRKALLNKLAQHEGKKRIEKFQNDRQVRRFLDGLANEKLS